MKKIKLFALAIMAMLSTNALADTDGTGGIFKFTYADANSGVITGLTTDLSDAAVKDIVIPATIKDASHGDAEVKIITVGNGTANVFGSYKTKIQSIAFAEGSNVTTIAAKAFDGCTALATATFTNATNLTTIGAGAFKGTVITALDLSKTKLAVVDNIFGTNLAYTTAEVGSDIDAVANAKIESITLPETWTKIAATQIGTSGVYIGAFENCTALTTVNFGTAKTGTAEGAQTIEQKAFLGTKVATFNVANTKLTALAANLFADGTKVATNATLTTVTLRAEGKITDFANAFNFCAGIAAIDLTGLSALNDGEFEGCAGLTAITIPNTIATISSSAFADCSKLATVTFAHTTQAFSKIKDLAFSGTAIAKITIPATLSATTADGVEATAFFNCSKLKEVTYSPAGTVTKAVINKNAFLGCEGVVITTTESYISANPTAPKNASYSSSTSGDATSIPFKTTVYKSNAKKFYIKYKAQKDIKIAKSDAKVYGAYLDEGNGTLNLQLYKAKNSFYYVAKDAVILVLTDNENLTYQDWEALAASTSWLPKEYGAGGWTAGIDNSLQIVTAKDGVSRGDLELAAVTADPDYLVYGWVNTNSGVGFQAITSGDTFPLGTLYVYAKAPAAGGRLNVVWRDENGNIEEETTAIQTIKTAKAEDGAIYNLAGQKVSASYKGVVIKDGKKYMQK